MDTADALFNDRTRRFGEFVDPADPDAPNAVYASEIRKMLSTGTQRLRVSLDDLREFDRELWRGCLNSPADFLPPLTQAVREAAETMRDPDNSLLESEDIVVGFSGTFGAHLLSPRTLKAPFLGKLVCVEGIVTRCTVVRPKVRKTVHYGPRTNEFFYREYRDQTTSFDPMPTTTTYPTEDTQGNPLVVEYGLSQYRDHQMVSIQEMPERAPPGQLPRGIDVVMDDDLVDTVKPGDRVQVVGVYRSVGGVNAGNQGAGGSGSAFRALLIGNNSVLLSSKGSSASSLADITDQDIRAINQLSKRPDIFHLLSQSLAPSIYGFAYIKQAVLLQLLGGTEVNLPNGSHIRGDINVLMVGDPSTAKSQMLRFVLGTASLAIATTGRGSTGVGLTAAVTTDKDTGERRLEAGAMVMADRGIVCVDEFDKMNDADRVAIHEVMEQQTVTISKAGIHTTLNARCSVLAAANPAYGQYDTHKEPHRNIALPDSLLSRFDLLFVVIDDVESAKDRAISEHVMRMHQFLPPGQAEGAPQRETGQTQLSVQNPSFEENKPVPVYTDASEALLSVAFVKRYIAYARERVKPVLGSEASEQIANIFAELRNDPLGLGQRRTAPVTPRSLETLIRLSSAHAKSRLSNIVELVDVAAAEEILRYAMFKEVTKATHGSKRRRVEEDVDLGTSSEEEDDDEIVDLGGDEEEEEGVGNNNTQELTEDTNNATQNAREQSQTPGENTSSSATNDENQTTDNTESLPDALNHLALDRQSEFEEIVGRLIAVDNVLADGSMRLADLIAKVNEKSNEPFNTDDVQAILKRMHLANKLFFDENEGEVYSI